MNSGAYVSSGKAKPSQTKKGPGGKGRRKQGDDCSKDSERGRIWQAVGREEEFAAQTRFARGVSGGTNSGAVACGGLQ
jgi:hypothetical protein